MQSSLPAAGASRLPIHLHLPSPCAIMATVLRAMVKPLTHRSPVLDKRSFTTLAAGLVVLADLCHVRFDVQRNPVLERVESTMEKTANQSVDREVTMINIAKS